MEQFCNFFAFWKKKAILSCDAVKLYCGKGVYHHAYCDGNAAGDDSVQRTAGKQYQTLPCAIGKGAHDQRCQAGFSQIA